MSFIQIAPPDQVIPYRFFDDEKGTPSDSVLILRVIPDDEEKALRKRHTSKIFNKKTRAYEDKLDTDAFLDEVVDVGIQSWSDVFYHGTTTPVPCDRPNKLRLPEKVKTEVIRIVVGKDLDAVAEEAAAPARPSTTSEPILSGR